jgi:hypothetical protein
LYQPLNNIEMTAMGSVNISKQSLRRTKRIATEQGVSLNQLAIYMFSREVASMEAGQRMSKYWKGYQKAEIIDGFDEVMSKVKTTNQLHLVQNVGCINAVPYTINVYKKVHGVLLMHPTLACHPNHLLHLT